MRQILFVQGGGAGAHDEWDHRLVEHLRGALGAGYEVRYPRMPNEGEPHFGAWKAALAAELAGLDDGAMVLGHSIGGTILVNVLAESTPSTHLAGIFLIAAPFVGVGGWPSDELASPTDLGARLPHATPVYLYHGSADDTAPVAHVELYARAIPGAIVRRLPGRDHQLNDDLTEVAADIRALT